MGQCMKKTPLQQVLENAAKLVEIGWCQFMSRSIETETGVYCYCLTGAIFKAAHDFNKRSSSRLYADACDVMREVVGQQCLTRWNDEHFRTQDDVVAVLVRGAVS